MPRRSSPCVSDRIPVLSRERLPVVGIGKHLCGAATGKPARPSRPHALEVLARPRHFRGLSVSLSCGHGSVVCTGALARGKADRGPPAQLLMAPSEIRLGALLLPFWNGVLLLGSSLPSCFSLCVLPPPLLSGLAPPPAHNAWRLRFSLWLFLRWKPLRLTSVGR